jgi:hypothetical protein
MYQLGLVFGDFNLSLIHLLFQSRIPFMDRYLDEVQTG